MTRAWKLGRLALAAGLVLAFAPATSAQDSAPRGPTLGRPANAKSDTPSLGRPANVGRPASGSEVLRGANGGEIQQAVFPPHPMNHDLAGHPWAQKHHYWQHNKTIGSWHHPYAQPGPAYYPNIVSGPVITGPMDNVCCDPCPPVCCEPMPCFDPCMPCDSGWCCPPPDYRGPPCWVYGGGEYLYWRTKSMNVPPLVTTSTNQEDLGVIGQLTTQVLLGGSIRPDDQSGGRFYLGTFLDPCHLWAIEGNYFFLSQGSRNYNFSSLGTPLLARPFFNVDDNSEDAQQVANEPLPDVFPLEGSVDIRLTTDLHGAELNLIRNLCYGSNPAWCKTYHVDFLFGYRYLNLRESLTITENLRVPETTTIQTPDGPITILEDTRFIVHDAFRTENTFHGGQIGLRGEMRWGNWIFDGRAKIAFGTTNSRADINGYTITSIPGQPADQEVGGLLALPTNIGSYRRDEFSIVPELGVNIGYQLCSWCRVYVGYTAIYWTNVVRPGDIIDRGVNPTQLPGATGLSGPARPAFTFRDSTFWVQGVNVGIELRY
jgi:hypothetical protein